MYLVGQEGITLLKVTKFDEYRNHNNYSTLIPSQMWSTVLVHKVFHWLGCSVLVRDLYQLDLGSRGILSEALDYRHSFSCSYFRKISNNNYYKQHRSKYIHQLVQRTLETKYFCCYCYCLHDCFNY